VPYTKKAKTFLEDMVKQKKVIKNNDGTYFVDVQDIHDMGGDIGVFKDIGNKFNYKTFKTDNYVDIEEIKDLRSYSSPLKNKMGKLDPVAGEQSPARMKILQRKLEEAGATKDKRLIDADELQELDKLEKIYLKPDERSLTPSSPLINISDPEVASDFANFAKQNDPEGYKKIEDIANKINQKIELENFDITGRKKNAKGGLNYLMGL
jgi:hypothetical protein